MGIHAFYYYYYHHHYYYHHRCHYYYHHCYYYTTTTATTTYKPTELLVTGVVKSSPFVGTAVHRQLIADTLLLFAHYDSK